MRSRIPLSVYRHRPTRRLNRNARSPRSASTERCDLVAEQRSHTSEEASGSRRCSMRSPHKTTSKDAARAELHRLDVSTRTASQTVRAAAPPRGRLDADDRAARSTRGRASSRSNSRRRGRVCPADQCEEACVTSQRPLVELDVPGAPTRSRSESVAGASRRNGMFSSARKNAPNTIWIPSPRPVTRSAVSYARPSTPKPFDAHSMPTATSPTTDPRASVLPI